MKYTDDMIKEATRIVTEKLAMTYSPELLQKCGIEETTKEITSELDYMRKTLGDDGTDCMFDMFSMLGIELRKQENKSKKIGFHGD